jgi:hypothetical protein
VTFDVLCDVTEFDNGRTRRVTMIGNIVRNDVAAIVYFEKDHDGTTGRLLFCRNVQVRNGVLAEASCDKRWFETLSRVSITDSMG